MSDFRRTVLSAAIVAILGSAQAIAQVYAQDQRPSQPTPVPARGENFSAGKTPAQLFASDCSGCHRAAQGLARNRSATSLGDFMREHYTNSRESAFALANYLNSLRNAAPPPRAPPTQAQTTPAGAPATASVPRPPGSIPEGDTLPGDPSRPVVEQPPKPTPGTPASKRGQRGAPAQAAARLPPPEPPPPPKPEAPEIFD